MALTEAQINQMYVDLGIEAVWPLRGNLNEVLGLYTNANGVAGAGIAYSAAGPESSRVGNVATFSGGATSYADLGSLAGVGSRVHAGGGLTLQFCFKIAGGVTAWRVGTLNSGSTQYLYYDVNAANNQIVYRRNNVEAGYIDYDFGMATAMRDDTWHVLTMTYNHVTAAWRTYIDGELWSDGSSASNRNTKLDGLAVNIANFMLGAYAFNTAATAPFASAFAEVAVAAKCFSDEQVRKLADLPRATFMPASYLGYRVGPRSALVASRVARDVRQRSSLLIALGDSRLTRNGQGAAAEPILARKINQASGNRIANCELRVGDVINADSLPGHYVSIAAGATQKFLVSTYTNEIQNSVNLLGGDNLNRRVRHLDTNQGIACTISMRRESGGRGPISYALKGADILPAATPLAGSENYVATISSGTLFTAEELTGAGTAVTTITPPSMAKYTHYQIEITNGGASAVILEDVDWISVANQGGPRVKVGSSGGYRIDSFYSAHPNWPRLIRSYSASIGSPNTHFLLVVGPNDGANLTSAGWRAALATFCAQLFADFPGSTLTVAMGGPVEPAGGNGALTNARMRNMPGAFAEFAAENPNLPISGVNLAPILERTAGWTPWNNSVSRYTVIGEYANATTYAQGNVVWARLNDANTAKRYWLSRFGGQTGVSLINVDKWTEVIRMLSDGIHYTELGSQVFVDAIMSGWFDMPPAGVGTPENAGGKVASFLAATI